MRKTIHVQQKMSQRGISRQMVDLVLEHGRIEQDKSKLGRDDARELLEEMQQKVKVLKKIIDKGGVTVVSDNNTFITTYNYNQGFFR